MTKLKCVARRTQRIILIDFINRPVNLHCRQHTCYDQSQKENKRRRRQLEQGYLSPQRKRYERTANRSVIADGDEQSQQAYSFTRKPQTCHFKKNGSRRNTNYALMWLATSKLITSSLQARIRSHQSFDVTLRNKVKATKIAQLHEILAAD